MAKPQHQTPEYRREKKRLTPIIASRGGWCHEVICLEATREITPGGSGTWHLAHDVTGTVILGEAHALCNLTEAAKRGRAKQLGRDAMKRRIL